MSGWIWAEPCHSVPSPTRARASAPRVQALAGEGQGEGYNTHRVHLVSRAQQKLTVVSERVCSSSFAPYTLSPPLSLSLPHHKGVHARLRRAMGGGNRAARAFATHAMCLRVDAQGMC